MTPHAPIPESLWNTVPPDAQAAIRAVLDSLPKRIAELENRLNLNSANSSKPPSADPPAVKVKWRPPLPPSGRKRGGQPGHKRHTRTRVPPEQIRETFEVKPTHCGGWGATLPGEDHDPVRHQVAEIPPVRPDVDAYRRHRLTCPGWGATTRANRPAGVPTGPCGPRLRAILALFAGSYRLAKRPIPPLAADLFGLDVSLGLISKRERRAADVLEPVVAAVAAASVPGHGGIVSPQFFDASNPGNVCSAREDDGRLASGRGGFASPVDPFLGDQHGCSLITFPV
jgi:transposase